MINRKTREDFLKAILILEQSSRFVRSTDLAKYLGVTRAFVSTTIRTLSEEGHVFKAETVPYEIVLTESGRKIAQMTYECHCFFRDWLIFAGVEPTAAEEEACRMEHAISPESFRLLRDAVRAPEKADA